MKENNVSLKGEPDWDLDSEKREHYITFIVNQLTLEEKTDMIHGAGFFKTKGVERLGIPPLTMSDGPMGARNEFYNDKWVPIGHSDDYVSYAPSNSASGCNMESTACI